MRRGAEGGTGACAEGGVRSKAGLGSIGVQTTEGWYVVGGKRGGGTAVSEPVHAAGMGLDCKDAGKRLFDRVDS